MYYQIVKDDNVDTECVCLIKIIDVEGKDTLEQAKEFVSNRLVHGDARLKLGEEVQLSDVHSRFKDEAVLIYPPSPSNPFFLLETGGDE